MGPPRLEVICKDTRPGEVVAVVGGCQALGDWQAGGALRLATSADAFPVWSGEAPALAAKTEFKAVVLQEGGAVRWEGLEGNRHWPADIPDGAVVRMYFGEPAEIVEEPVESQTFVINQLSGSKTFAEPAEGSDEETAVPASPGSPQPGVPKRVSSSRLRERLLAAATKGKIEDFYELEPQPIGKGAFGVVCKARPKGAHAADGMRAVKTVRLQDIQDANAFVREIDLSRSMDHPNLIKLFHSFETNDYIYLVTELCEGGELFDRIIEAGHFSEQQAASVMRQMFKAISYMHGISICHRDIKPENFLFQTKEPIHQAPLKLIDFGLSKRFQAGEAMTSKVGTPTYVAPEVLRGSYGPECDVWSIGTMMYCLLSGREPFGGRTMDEILRRVLSGRYSLDGPLWEAISADARDLLAQLLKLDPKARIHLPDAITHKWLETSATKESECQMMHHGMLRNLTAWRTHSRFERAAMVAIAGQLSDEDIAGLKDVFLKCDKDHDGHLSLAEMRDGLREAQLEIPDALEQIMQDIDSADHQGTISYSEFLAATLDRRSMARKDLCWHAFRNFDTDNDGHLSIEEVAAILQCDFLKDLPEAQAAAEVLSRADANHDGTLSFDEFLAFFTDPRSCELPA